MLVVGDPPDLRRSHSEWPGVWHSTSKYQDLSYDSMSKFQMVVDWRHAPTFRDSRDFSVGRPSHSRTSILVSPSASARQCVGN